MALGKINYKHDLIFFLIQLVFDVIEVLSILYSGYTDKAFNMYINNSMPCHKITCLTSTTRMAQVNRSPSYSNMVVLRETR